MSDRSQRRSQQQHHNHGHRSRRQQNRGRGGRESRGRSRQEEEPARAAPSMEELLVPGETSFPSGPTQRPDGAQSDAATVNTSNSDLDDLEVEQLASREESSSPHSTDPVCQPNVEGLEESKVAASPQHPRGASSRNDGESKQGGGSSLDPTQMVQRTSGESILSAVRLSQVLVDQNSPENDSNDSAGNHSLDVEVNSLGGAVDAGIAEQVPEQAQVQLPERESDVTDPVPGEAPPGRRSPGGTLYIGQGHRRYQGLFANLALRRFHQGGVDPHSLAPPAPAASSNEAQPSDSHVYDDRQAANRAGRRDLGAARNERYERSRRTRSRSRSRSPSGSGSGR